MGVERGGGGMGVGLRGVVVRKQAGKASGKGDQRDGVLSERVRCLSR